MTKKLQFQLNFGQEIWKEHVNREIFNFDFENVTRSDLFINTDSKPCLWYWRKIPNIQRLLFSPSETNFDFSEMMCKVGLSSFRDLKVYPEPEQHFSASLSLLLKLKKMVPMCYKLYGLGLYRAFSLPNRVPYFSMWAFPRKKMSATEMITSTEFLWRKFC